MGWKNYGKITETGQFVLKHLEIKNVNKDAYLLAQKSSILLNKD